MEPIDEGYIKYRQHHEFMAAHQYEIEELVAVRNRLAQLGLIGVYPGNIGFGNVSQRLPNNAGFLISGTQTGHIKLAAAEHFAQVVKVDIAGNSVFSQGPVQASSESLTHAAIYAADAAIAAVIHVHHKVMWEKYMNKLTTINAHIAYGTPEMAEAIQENVLKIIMDTSPQIIITAGHTDGVFIFGNSLTDAYNCLMTYYDACNK